MTIDTKYGMGVIPFNSGVPLTDMGLVNLACQTMAMQYMIVAQTPPDKKPTPDKDTAA